MCESHSDIKRLQAENESLIQTLQQPDQVGYWQRRCEIAEARAADEIKRLRAALRHVAECDAPERCIECQEEARATLRKAT
jgi:hypothetical protein